MSLNVETFRTGVKLDPQSSDPASPSEGQLQYADGTARQEGLWIYKNGAWEKAGAAAVSAGSSAVYDVQNLGIACSVGSSALTIALKGKDGNNPSGSNVVTVGVRNSTLTTGTYNTRTVEAALSLVISSGSTLGHTNNTEFPIYVYLIDSDGAGAMKLAVSTTQFNCENLYTTVAEGGAGGADSGTTLYSDAVYSSKPMTLIGKLKSTQATAGTWAAVPTNIVLKPVSKTPVAIVEDRQTNGTVGGTATTSAWTARTLNITSGDQHIIGLSSNTITLQAGEYSIDAWSAFYRTGVTRIRFRNTTDGTTVAISGVDYQDSSNGEGTLTAMKGKFTITSAKDFQVQYYVSSSAGTSTLGAASTGSGEEEVHTQVKITQLAKY